jgi:hypothetical protein
MLMDGWGAGHVVLVAEFGGEQSNSWFVHRVKARFGRESDSAWKPK